MGKIIDFKKLEILTYEIRKAFVNILTAKSGLNKTVKSTFKLKVTFILKN